MYAILLSYSDHESWYITESKTNWDKLMAVIHSSSSVLAHSHIEKENKASRDAIGA